MRLVDSTLRIRPMGSDVQAGPKTAELFPLQPCRLGLGRSDERFPPDVFRQRDTGPSGGQLDPRLLASLQPEEDSASPPGRWRLARTSASRAARPFGFGRVLRHGFERSSSCLSIGAALAVPTANDSGRWEAARGFCAYKNITYQATPAPPTVANRSASWLDARTQSVQVQHGRLELAQPESSGSVPASLPVVPDRESAGEYELSPCFTTRPPSFEM